MTKGQAGRAEMAKKAYKAMWQPHCLMGDARCEAIKAKLLPSHQNRNAGQEA